MADPQLLVIRLTVNEIKPNLWVVLNQVHGIIFKHRQLPLVVVSILGFQNEFIFFISKNNLL